jgi:hypothetical protein
MEEKAASPSAADKKGRDVVKMLSSKYRQGSVGPP